MGWGVKQMLMSLSQLAHMSSRGKERDREMDWHLSISIEIYSVVLRSLFHLPYTLPKLRCQEINYSLWENSLFVSHTLNTLNCINC